MTETTGPSVSSAASSVASPSPTRSPSAPTAERADDVEDQLELLRDEIQEVSDLVAPVWPLRDYVAVNPWLGLSDRRFAAARRLLRSVSDAEMLMPLDYYRDQFASGQLTADDVREAVLERNSDEDGPGVTAESVLETLQQLSESEPAGLAPHRRRIRTIAEIADGTSDSAWADLVTEEVGRFCASWFDEGQAVWKGPWKDLELFQAWRSSAQIDLRGPLLGLSRFKAVVTSLPHTPEAAIAWALTSLRIPSELWGPFLLCQACSIPGWCAWAKYRDSKEDAGGREPQSLVSLLAIRLAWDVAISQSLAIRVDWASLLRIWHASGQRARLTDGSDTDQRLVLLRASELAYQRTLLSSLKSSASDDNESKTTSGDLLAQMVFCIDVRSERYRRHLESGSDQVKTFGFAGFFGVPVARQTLDTEQALPQVPALLNPAVTVADVLPGQADAESAATLSRFRWRRHLRSWWKQLQSSAVSCFGFVETAGLLFGSRLLTNTLRKNDRVVQSMLSQPETAPDLQALEKSGWSLNQQVDLAESILRGIGLTSEFAPLVLLCGHASTVVNNPLQASLDCGACCGHSGEFNARFATGLLNRGEIRRALQQRGISIPQQTWFSPAVHHTTTDELTFPEATDIPDELQASLHQLQRVTAAATQQSQAERLPTLGAENIDQLLARTRDWSEVRPEWGLAGNAAFIAGPRDWTRGLDLGGRTFLHSYDEQTDADFAVLEQILTAPVVVAHWINMQYYASSVDNRSYGSGSKTIHNVVGRMGILSGNGGDLMTGLPWQSVSDGEQLRHQPLRLLTAVKAPRSAVEDILQRHPAVEDLIVNQWMNLLVCDRDTFYRYTPRRSWQAVPQSHCDPCGRQESPDSSVAGDCLSEPQTQGV